MSKVFVALIADAVDSRRLAPPHRHRLQAALQAQLRDLNRRYHAALAARFDVTLGDELQCLLWDATRVWEISHHIRHAFPDVDWTIACGRGAVTTALTPGITAPKVDGPCFHEARAALEAAKRERRILAFGGFAGAELHAFAAYYSALYWGWTPRQRRQATLWRAAERVPTPRPRDDLHPSAYSHLRRRMAWPLVESGDKMFRALLEAR